MASVTRVEKKVINQLTVGRGLRMRISDPRTGLGLGRVAKERKSSRENVSSVRSGDTEQVSVLIKKRKRTWTILAIWL